MFEACFKRRDNKLALIVEKQLEKYCNQEPQLNYQFKSRVHYVVAVYGVKDPSSPFYTPSGIGDPKVFKLLSEYDKELPLHDYELNPMLRSLHQKSWQDFALEHQRHISY